MKRWKQGGIWLALLVFLCLGCAARASAQDGSGFNLIRTVSRQPGKPGRWIRSREGYRYRYTADKTYAKNTWLMVGKHIFFMDQDGYRLSGFKKYKKNTYYLDEKGRLVTGWQKIAGKKYYFSRKTGAMAVGQNTIGKNDYCFSEKGVLQKNVWIGEQYADQKGRLQKGKRIFVGDSRTVGMQQAVKSSDRYLAKWGKGYEWFAEEGKKQLEKLLKKYPYSAVILNLGVNDLANADAYLLLYQKLQADHPQAKFYFMSVNPVEETFLRRNGFGGRENPAIEQFNEKMKAVFGKRYLDTYHWLIGQGYIRDVPEGHGTTDGLHYTEGVYRKLHQYALDWVLGRRAKNA